MCTKADITTMYLVTRLVSYLNIQYNLLLHSFCKKHTAVGISIKTFEKPGLNVIAQPYKRFMSRPILRNYNTRSIANKSRSLDTSAAVN